MTPDWLSVPITLLVGVFAFGAIWLACERAWKENK
jgi:hypothetical protein